MQEDKRWFTVSGVPNPHGCTGRIDDATGREAHRVCAGTVASVVAALPRRENRRLIAWPSTGALALIWTITWYAVFFGCMFIGLAFELKKFRRT
jgi:hypothetical protein